MKCIDKSNKSSQRNFDRLDNLQFYGSSEARAPGATNDMERVKIAKLVCLAKTGDTDALGALASCFSGTIFSYLLPRTRNAELATELTQQTMIRMCSRIWQIEAPLAFYSWIHTIAHNIHQSYLRTTKRSLNDSEHADCALQTKSSNEPEPIMSLEASEAVDLTRKIISSLSELDSTVLKRFYLEGESVSEISKSLACPVGTVKSRLHIARLRFREKCEELGLEII